MSYHPVLSVQKPFALNKSEVTSPAAEHSADGASPEIPHIERVTTPSGILN